jgi:hypothetical protein
MRTFSLIAAFGLALGAATLTATAEDSVELAFMPETKTVTLLNEGGKYVAIDLKHIPQGGTCRMDKDATLVKVGPGSKPETTLMRYAAPQVSSGGCPFMTTFELSSTDYAAARAIFKSKEADASKKLADMKKQLGDKWEELTGTKN